MASLATWVFTLTIVGAGLAGCVKPYPDDSPPDCADELDGCAMPCEGCYSCYSSFTSCCYDCGSPPPSPPTRWPEPPTCPAANFSSFSEPMMTCVYPVPVPPLLATLSPLLLLSACAECQSASIASDGDRVFVATERALIVVTDAELRVVELPEGPLATPHVAVDELGNAWVAGIDMDPPVPRVVLATYAGGDDFALVATLETLAAPVLPLAKRAYVAPLDDGAVVLLEAEGAAWSVRYVDGAFSLPERITPLGGDALVGAPAFDARGRAFVPFAFTPRDPLQALTSTLMPVVTQTSLHYAALPDARGEWTTHGGMFVAQGASSAPSLETMRAGVSAFAWVDSSGALQRIETWDEGTSWGSPAAWSDLSSSVIGAPATDRMEHRATTSWWEDASGTARLVVARGEGSTPMAQQIVVEKEHASDAALALLRDGRAVVAWVDEKGDVWAGVEGAALPPRGCDDTAHCGRNAPMRW